MSDPVVLACPYDPCRTVAPNAARLALHIAEMHGLAYGAALLEAQKLKPIDDQPRTLRVVPDARQDVQAAADDPITEPEPLPRLHEETPMPVVVKGPDSCSFCIERKKKGLGPCGHHGGPGNSRRKGTRRATLKPPEPKPAKAATPALDPLPADAGIRATARRLLAQLEEMRQKLDRRIEAVRELAEIL